MVLRIGRLPKSIAEIAKMNKLVYPETIIEEIKKLHREKKITPIFDECQGVKVCLWKRC